jgi:Ser/Thr protein kinase RdoA (MazF antagonist)
MPGALAAWGQLEVTGSPGGGYRNTVLELRRGQERLVARRSRRPPASLDWEVSLLDHLARHGLRVPAVVPARDGRRHVDGVLVLTWLDGTPPGPARLTAARLAVTAWEAASGWTTEPGYAGASSLS